jgi:hypothetical protein
MNPMVPLDLRDFFFCKRYDHLMGWSTPVDLGHDILDLGYDVLDLDYDILDLGYDILDLGYDILDLGYDILDKNKKVRGRGSRQISRQNVEITW